MLNTLLAKISNDVYSCNKLCNYVVKPELINDTKY